MANQRDISLPEAIFVHHAFGGIQITHNKRHLWIKDRKPLSGEINLAIG